MVAAILPTLISLDDIILDNMDADIRACRIRFYNGENTNYQKYKKRAFYPTYGAKGPAVQFIVVKHTKKR